MKYRVYVDESKKRKDGMMPVVVIFEDSGRRFKVNTGLTAREKFTGREFPSTEPSARVKTTALGKKLLKIDEHLILEDSESWADTQAFVRGVFGKKEREKARLHELVRQLGERKKTENTRKIYIQAAAKVERFDTKATLDSLSRGWMEDFEAWLEKNGNKAVNGRATLLRCVKATANWAYDEGMTKEMPLRKFTVKKERVAINNITVEQLRLVRDMKVKKKTEVYRDMFMLSFYLCGINPVDLLGLTEENVRNGRLVYRRRKTGKLIDIPICGAAEELINRYRGTKRLLCVAEGGRAEELFTNSWNKQLKGIIKGMTVYTARYTFASIGAELEIPRETIALCLGHSWADVTSHYIAYDMRRVNEAVRKIVDYVNGDLDSPE